jgi:hypothetical protein
MEKSPISKKRNPANGIRGFDVFAFTSGIDCARGAERPHQRSKILKNQTESREESGEEGANSLQEAAV